MRRIWEPAQLLLILLILIAAPLAFGGVHRPVWAALMLVVGLIALCASLQNRALPEGGGLFLGLGGVVVGLAFCGLVRLPAAGLQRLSPVLLQVQQATRALGDEGLSYTSSILPYATHQQSLALLSAWLLVCAILLRKWERPSVMLVIAAIFTTASAIALYGLYQVEFGKAEIYGLAKRYYKTQATGTYVNKNHFAGLMELGIPLGIALLALPIKAAGWRQFTRIGAGLGMLVMSLALVWSHSRMGLLSLSVGLLGMVVLAFFTRRSGVYFLLFLICLAPIVSINIATGFGPVRKALGIFEREDRRANERLAVWTASLQLVQDHPILGVGAGNWGAAFARVHPPRLPNVYDEAHNDYLQLLVELGPVALLAVLIAIYSWFRRMIRLAHTLPPDERMMAIGIVGAVLSLLVHSLADFNMQIPANRYLLIVLAALGLCLGQRTPDRSSSDRRGGLARCRRLLIAVMGLTLIWSAGRILLAERHAPFLLRESSVLFDRSHFLEALDGVKKVERTRRLRGALKQSERLLDWDPDNPQWLYERGVLCGLLSRAAGLSAAEIGRLRQTQLATYRRAVMAAPMDGRYRYGFGILLYQLGQHRQADRQLALAHQFDKRNAALQYRCAIYFRLRHQQTNSAEHFEQMLQSLEASCATGLLEDTRRGTALLWRTLPEVRYLERILLPEHLEHGISFLVKQGWLRDALRLLQTDPEWRNKADRLVEAGKLHWLQGQSAQAREMWRLAVVGPDTTRRTWDRLESFLERYRQAWPQLLAYLARQPVVPAETYYRLAALAMRDGKPKLALGFIDRAIRARPKELRYLELRSRITVPRKE